MSFTIDILPALADHYIYLITDEDLGLAMVIDPSDAGVVTHALQKKDLHLALILNTHNPKNTGNGSEKLQSEYGAPIIGPLESHDRLGSLSRKVSKADVITFSTLRGQVLETHGAISGHVAFYFPQLKALFCGDTLFSLGCGKLFEGRPSDLWETLAALRSLPDDTLIYCGREFTEANAKFALAVDKNNEALKGRVAEVKQLRQKGLPSVPVLLSVEKQTNPFLRVDHPPFQSALAKGGIAAHDTDPAAILGTLRAAKDRFGSL